MSTFLLSVCVILLFTLGTVVWQLMKQRLSPPEYRPVGMEEFPPHALTLLQGMTQELTAQGMTFVELQHEMRSNREDSWQVVMRSEDGSVWAVCETYVVAKQDKTRLVLQSYFADGTVVITANDSFADIAIPPNWRLIQKPFASGAEQLRVHRGGIQALGKIAEQVLRIQTAAELRDRYAAVGRAELEYLQARKYLVPAGGDANTFRFSWGRLPWLSLKVLWFVVLAIFKSEAPQAEPAQREGAQAATGDARPELRRLELYRQESGKGNLFGKLGWTGKGLVFLLSMIAFMALFYFRGILELTTLGWVVVILVIHELGHALTMKVFGYRNVQIFFIPFLGAAAAGTKKRVPAWQEFWVFIMGPLPGLVAGWGIMAWSMWQPGTLPSWLEEFALWSVILNGFNLLPFLPLDGGRIVELLIFNRLPSFRVVFVVLGGVALILMAFMSWWFLFLAVIMLLTVTEATQIAGLSPWIRHSLKPEDTEDEALLKTFQIIEHTGNAKVYTKPTWPGFVDRLVQMGCGRRMDFFGTAAALGLYAMLIGLPVLLGVGMAFKAGWDQATTEEKVTERIVELETEVSWPSVPVGDPTRALLDEIEAAYWDMPTLGSMAAEDAAGLEAADPAGGGAMENLMNRLVTNLQQQEDRYDKLLLPAARKLRWDEVPAWVAEDESVDRQLIVHELVGRLIAQAQAGIAMHNDKDAERDLTLTYWAIASCEPRQSFGLWQGWLEMELQCLQLIEKLNAGGRMTAGTRTWLAGTLPNGPRPTGPKMALLCLHDASVIFSSAHDSMFEGIDPADDSTPGEMDPSDHGAPAPAERFGWEFLVKMFTGNEIKEYLAVADFWAARPELAEIPPGELGVHADEESWNESVRRIRHILRYRQLGAHALAAPAGPDSGLEDIDGRPLTRIQGPEGDTWSLQPEAGDPDEEAMEWRMPPRG